MCFDRVASGVAAMQGATQASHQRLGCSGGIQILPMTCRPRSRVAGFVALARHSLRGVFIRRRVALAVFRIFRLRRSGFFGQGARDQVALERHLCQGASVLRLPRCATLRAPSLEIRVDCKCSHRLVIARLRAAALTGRCNSAPEHNCCSQYGTLGCCQPRWRGCRSPRLKQARQRHMSEAILAQDIECATSRCERRGGRTAF